MVAEVHSGGTSVFILGCAVSPIYDFFDGKLLVGNSTSDHHNVPKGIYNSLCDNQLCYTVYELTWQLKSDPASINANL